MVRRRPRIENTAEQTSARPAAVAAQIRNALRDSGSAEHAAGVQWFFKEEIKSHGWYTADLRRAVSVDDGSLPAALRPVASTFICDKSTPDHGK